MDNFIVSARKYRPRKFGDVIGQQSIANTLKKAIHSNKLASAYLFCGPRGVGKTTCARIFAKAINCLHPQPNGEPCDECESCTAFNQQRAVNIQELNAAANNSVDNIRAIIEQVYIPPQLGKYKVVILDEVHMLSQSASNALLKTLEEPPSYVVFILATTEKHKILPTIQSRCQIFDFNRMEINDIVGNLKMVAEKEHITYEEAALNIIAQKADGGMRDALSIFDQVSNFSQNNITYDSVLQCINALDDEYYFKMTDFLVSHNVVESMLLFNDIVNKGFSGGVFMAGMASHCRDLLMSRDPSTLQLLNVAQSNRQRYTEQAQKCSVKFLYHAIRSFDRCSNDYKTALNKRLSVEITLIETAQFSDDDSPGSGLRPARRLKPLFKQTDRLQTAATYNATVRPHNADASTNSTPRQAAARPNTVQAHTPTVTASGLSGTAGRTKHISIPEALAMVRAGNSSKTTQTRQESKPTELVPHTDCDTYTDDDRNPPPTAILYSAKQVETQWKKCSEAIKASSVSMSQRMIAMPVECKPDHTIIVSLHNENTQKDLAKFIPFIEASFNKAFNLDDIKIKTEIIPTEIIKVITNPVALLNKMREDYPDFAKIVEELDMRLT